MSEACFLVVGWSDFEKGKHISLLFVSCFKVSGVALTGRLIWHVCVECSREWRILRRMMQTLKCHNPTTSIGVCVCTWIECRQLEEVRWSKVAGCIPFPPMHRCFRPTSPPSPALHRCVRHACQNEVSFFTSLHVKEERCLVNCCQWCIVSISYEERAKGETWRPKVTGDWGWFERAIRIDLGWRNTIVIHTVGARINRYSRSALLRFR